MQQEITEDDLNFLLRPHLILFVFSNGMLFIINYLFTTEFLWAFIPLFGWLIGLSLHIDCYLYSKYKFGSKFFHSVIIHLILYSNVNLLLVSIDLLITKRLTWTQYPIFFWGTGLLLHIFLYIDHRIRKSKKKFSVKKILPQKIHQKKKDISLEIKLEEKKIKNKKSSPQKRPSQLSINKSLEEKYKLLKTEREMNIEKEKYRCIVHKGPITGELYLCPHCQTFYCATCARALRNKQELCWSCGKSIEIT